MHVLATAGRGSSAHLGEYFGVRAVEALAEPVREASRTLRTVALCATLAYIVAVLPRVVRELRAKRAGGVSSGEEEK